MKTKMITLQSWIGTIAQRVAFGLFTAVALLLTSCDKENHDPDAAPFLGISPTTQTIHFGTDAKESYTYKITTNRLKWMASCDRSWCNLHIDAGANTLTITANPNDKITSPAPATITITSGDAAPLTITATQDGATYDLYLSGYYQTDNGTRACYWKNGTRVDLPVVDESPMDESRAITVSNGSVYIAGRGEMSGCYWKDGVCTKLTEYYAVRSIAVDNETVYVLGYGSLLWKDGVLQEVDWANDFTPYALTVTDGTLNVAGRIHLEIPVANYSADLAACGTPQSPQHLSTPIVSALSDALCVTSSAGSVYVGGYYYDKDANIERPCFWKDKQPTTLEVPKGANDSSVEAICVENGSVYSAGHCWVNERRTPVYWTNENYTELQCPSNATEAEITGIAAVSGTVYVSGIYRDEKYIAHACYWVNGVVTTLPETPDSNQYTSGIALMKK